MFQCKDGALAAGINFNKTTMMLLTQDLKAVTGRVGKVENDLKKGLRGAEDKLTSFKSVILELDSTVGDLVGSMGTIMDDGDALNEAIEALQTKLADPYPNYPNHNKGNQKLQPPALVRRISDPNSLEGYERGAQRVKETMDGFIKTAALLKEESGKMSEKIAILESKVSDHAKLIIENKGLIMENKTEGEELES